MRGSQDLSIDCASARHKLFEMYAWVMVLVFPGFVPLWTGFHLWRVRHRLNPAQATSEADAIRIRACDRELAPFVQLFSPYRPRFWYFDCVDLMRRIIM